MTIKEKAKIKPNKVTVFEYDSLHTYQGKRRLTDKELHALQLFHAGEGQRYYQLVNKGVRFSSYVGVIQVGQLVIEILPKVDKVTNGEKEEELWQRRLIEMLSATGVFPVKAPTNATLGLKTNRLLDLYFELFIQELEYLYHKGLIKRYRKVSGNKQALKGKILFDKHIRHNLVHQERFFVKYSQYDHQHLLHMVLYKCLQLLREINTYAALSSRIGQLLLLFPEMPSIKVSEATFQQFPPNRKTTPYLPALAIAQLLLLNYHPDLQKGHHHVLALLFDMNKLWEQFIYVSLQKHLPKGWSIGAQSSKPFWQAESGSQTVIKPDIILYLPSGQPLILDTKWKDIGSKTPSASDLQQLFAYLMLYRSSQVALVYPGKRRISSGYYRLKTHKDVQQPSCTVLCIPSGDNIQVWQEQIAYQVFGEWLGSYGPS